MTPGEAPGNVVCDLDGVIYRAGAGVPGAGEALSEIERRGYRLIFATNSPLRTRRQVADHIAAATGYRADDDQVVTAAMAAARTLGPADCPILVVGEAALVAELEGAGLTVTGAAAGARTVVVGLDRRFTYDHLRAATQAVLGGARLVAATRAPTYPTESGLWPGGGAIVAAVEAATGRSAEVVGKPHGPMRAEVRRRLGPGPTWIVGDRPETDVAMGRLEGWVTVMVLTGVVGEEAAVPAHLRPDLLLGGIAELPGRLP